MAAIEDFRLPVMARARGGGSTILALVLGIQSLLLFCCGAPESTHSGEPDSQTSTETSRESAKENSANYPRIVFDPLKGQESQKMFEKGEHRSIQLKDGRRIRARHQGDSLEIQVFSKEGKALKNHRIASYEDMNHSIYPVGPYVLWVTGVNAGPAGEGTLLNPDSGKTRDLLVRSSFDGEKYPMSLYIMSLVESRPDVFILAGTGNTSLLRIDIRGNSPVIQEFPFQEVPLLADFGAFIRNGKVFYKFRENPGEGPWTELKAPDAVQP